MDLLQECSKNIEKLEFKHSGKKNGGKTDSMNESPLKVQTINTSKAAVCLVDLSKKEDMDESIPLRVHTEDKDVVHEDDEEFNSQKNLPNLTN
jgi:hypothetical protein